METPLQKIKEFCQDQENEFSVLGYDASKYELGYISAIREIQEICEEIPDPTAQLQADKAELLEALDNSLKVIEWYMENTMPENDNHTDFFNIGMNQRSEIESLIQKMKQ